MMYPRPMPGWLIDSSKTTMLCCPRLLVAAKYLDSCCQGAKEGIKTRIHSVPGRSAHQYTYQGGYPKNDENRSPLETIRGTPAGV